MGLLCDYFTASSDLDAKETIDWVGGPGKPPPPRGLFRRKAVAAHATVSLPGMEPTTWMGKLEEVLTGRPFEDILKDPSGKMVAFRDGGERLVIPMTSNLQDTLAALEDDRVEEIARRWAEPDEYYGAGMDARDAQSILTSLIALLRSGRGRGERLFCWVCV
jgi:hypothetical protein